MDDLKWLILVLVGAVLLLVVVFVGVILAAEYGSFPGASAEIEALRQDVRRVGRGADEDILGQAATANRIIASKKEYNTRWWACWMIPNGWGKIEPIDVTPIDGEE